jgi:hypothetical protein
MGSSLIPNPGVGATAGSFSFDGFSILNLFRWFPAIGNFLKKNIEFHIVVV